MTKNDLKKNTLRYWDGTNILSDIEYMSLFGVTWSQCNHMYEQCIFPTPYVCGIIAIVLKNQRRKFSHINDVLYQIILSPYLQIEHRTSYYIHRQAVLLLGLIYPDKVCKKE